MKTDIQVPEKFTATKIEKIAFFGSAEITKDNPLYQEVYQIAQRLAKNDKVIVNGGGPGVMRAATEGAESVSGKSVAVTLYPKDMPEFEGRDQDNIVSTEIKTANYIERMFGLIYYSDLFICFQGGTGTLSEWATSWLMAYLYYGNHKPIILYGVFWREVMAVIEKHFLICDKEKDVYTIVDDQQQLLTAIDEWEKKIASRHQ